MSNKLPADPDTAGLRTPRRSTALRAAKVSVLRPADVECVLGKGVWVWKRQTDTPMMGRGRPSTDRY